MSMAAVVIEGMRVGVGVREGGGGMAREGVSVGVAFLMPTVNCVGVNGVLI